MSAFPQQLEKVVLTLCEDVGSPVATKVAELVRARDFGSLVRMSVNPASYACPLSYLEDASVVELLRKYSGFDIPDIDKAGVALRNFYAAEESCKKANDRLTRFVNAQGPFEDPSDLRLLECFEWMRSWIRDVLGGLPRELQPSFGPGATYGDVGRYITVPDKMSSRPSTTLEARALLPLWETTAWCRYLVRSFPSHSDPEVVRGNRFTTVPKDATKDRGIAIEPSINVFYQLGLGRAIRRRLLFKTGIDLDYGQEFHRRLAKEASRTGSHATIDLSNASDTVSRVLVELLLPRGWFDLLCTLRSPRTLVKGRWVHLQKFSSMGNGFTFELETLIFSAIVAYSCHVHGLEMNRGRNATVFGDDIILPTEASGTCLSLLRFCGFTPNPAKTYVSGPFRESCGGDYFQGKAVRPYYVKKVPDEPAKWIALANGIRRLGHQDPYSEFRWSTPWRAWLRALDALPSDIRRNRGPEDLGDLVVHDASEFWSVRPHPERPGIKQIRTWAPVKTVVRWHHWKPEIVLAAALYGGRSEGVSPRGSVSGYRHRWATYPL